MKPMSWEDALRLNGKPGFTGKEILAAEDAYREAVRSGGQGGLELYDRIRQGSVQPSGRDRRTWAILGREERSCNKHGAFQSRLEQLDPAPKHPMFAPRWTTCPACDVEIEAEARETSEASAEMRRTLDRLRLVNAGVPEMYHGTEMRHWFSQHPKINRVFRGVNNFANTIEGQIEQGRNLIFSGNPGTGKTMLACIVLRHLLLKHGGTGKYLTQTRLMSRVKLTMDRDRATESEDQVFDALSGVDLLVLDEIGRGSASEWERSVLFRLIDERYQRQCKPMLALTNLDEKPMREYLGDAAMDRLTCRGSTFVRFDWESMRANNHDAHDD